MNVSTSSRASDNRRRDAAAGFRLEDEGFCVIRAAMPLAKIKALAAALEPDFAETPFCQGDFYGARTKRFGRLLARAPAVAELVQHPSILALARRVLKPWCDTIQLNLTQAIAVHPGALAQFPHRDQDMWRGEPGRLEYLLNVMWPLTRFTAQNGATRLWPDSHGFAALDDQASAEPVVAECAPGDALVFLGSTRHGAGANEDSRPRRGILISYCLGWLKPYENQWLAYPPEVARHFEPDLAALVGYQQHRPNLGNFEGRCPSILLGNGHGGPIGAIDALRPDQTTMLADYVARQCANVRSITDGAAR